MTIKTIQIVVTGQVQGVGFRFSTYQKATKIKLTGYVKNLSTGQVEIVTQGSEEQIKELLQWLDDGGPRSAHIERYHVTDYTKDTVFSRFAVTY
ncbi:acylphosphatase [Zophobihabitans entericus]|uniref:Acylphosphatase n=1 Tax=Zophobihabitans entericus TaxID=1635327 RepID=A0A6G9IDL9_9GAMM|nr:acylphosphatase [Zophobihabitans entericus]QIQ22323.1 acylphosphatase [Zophobihabitans entericus]